MGTANFTKIGNEEKYYVILPPEDLKLDFQQLVIEKFYDIQENLEKLNKLYNVNAYTYKYNEKWYGDIMVVGYVFFTPPVYIKGTSTYEHATDLRIVVGLTHGYYEGVNFGYIINRYNGYEYQELQSYNEIKEDIENAIVDALYNNWNKNKKIEEAYEKTINNTFNKITNDLNKIRNKIEEILSKHTEELCIVGRASNGEAFYMKCAKK